jgi:hypothetical protein
MPPADLMRRTERDAVSAMIDVVRQSADRLEALARGAT